MKRILHAGLHKTGSTFLQKNLFSNIDSKNFYFIGDNFGLESGLIISEHVEILLFSNEASCGHPYPVAQEFSIDILRSNVTVLGIDSIILVTRDFESWILSLYYQTLNEGYTWSLNTFLKKNKDNLRAWTNCEQVIKKYALKSGLDLLIFNQEELLNNPQELCDRICQFIGVEPVSVNYSSENISKYEVLHINIYRLLNAIFKFKLVRVPFRLIRTSPRNLMQNGVLGKILSRICKKKLLLDDVGELL